MKRPALWRHLWRWTLVALGIAWLTLMGASYYAGLHEAGEVTDAHLASAVNVLLQVSAFGTQPGEPLSQEAPPEPGFQSFIPLGRHLNLTRSLAVVVWDNGSIVADSRPPDQRWPITQVDGYATFAAPAAAGQEPHHWRMFVSTRAGSNRRAAAMIEVEQRTRIGRHVAMTIARPALVVLPVIALLLWWSLRRGLKPLNTFSARVAGLNLDSGERLDDAHKYDEFDSMVRAINDLIDKLQAQLAREREFASDVAHELRTPLAAITLQAELAAASDAGDGTRAAALAALQRESLRAGRILGELLDLARAQRRESAANEDIDLGELAAQSLGSFAQSSHESGHVLELDCVPTPVVVHANPLLLDLALRNLINNALRHTGAGTLVRITVSAPQGRRVVSVSDDGQRVGRTTSGGGTESLGIGLKLVERIAHMQGAQFMRDGAQAPMTTCFSLCWEPDAQPV